MKKILTGIILAFTFLCNASVAEGHTIEVGTGEEFWNAIYDNLDDPNVIIQLTNTIDMKEDYDTGGQFESSYYKPFKGTITGYYTIVKDGKEKECMHVIKNVNSAILDCMEGAKVKGIKFKDCDTGGDFTDYYPAILVCNAKNCEFTELVFENCKYKDGFVGTIPTLKSGFGLMADNLYQCKVNSVIFSACSLYKKGSGIGNMAGYAEDTEFTRCTTDRSSIILGDAAFNTYVGGIVGEAYRCKFDDCVNMATVAGSEKADNVGGITGWSQACTFEHCINSGELATMNEEGWGSLIEHLHDFNETCSDISEKLIGYKESEEIIRKYQMATDNISSMSIEDASEYFDIWFDSALEMEELYRAELASLRGTIIGAIITICLEVYEGSEPDEMGGITSASEGDYIHNCLNAGIIHCRDAYAGGIVGRAKSHDGKGTEIVSCINRAYIQGDEQTGGIVGSLDENSKVRYCINTGAVDVIKTTRGPIYGENKGSQSNLKGNFVLTHDANYTAGSAGDKPINNVSIKDIKSGLVASELNNLDPENNFCQNIGVNACPLFEGKKVTANDIRDDVDLHYDVDNKEEFLMALSDQYADIRLTKDIDFGGQLWTLYSRFTPFRGTIDGQEHSLKNIVGEISRTVDGYEEGNTWDRWLGEWQYSAPIGGAENATFKHLIIEGMNLKLSGMASGFVGLSTNCTYDWVRVRNSKVTASRNCVGALICQSDGDSLTHCMLESSSLLETTDFNLGHYSSYAGGLVSKAKGSKFYDCKNNGKVKTRTDYAAGIVSEAEDCVLMSCVNHGEVSHNSDYVCTDDYLGGIAAKATNTTFTRCVNEGQLCCEDQYGGGIVGYGTNVTINNCLNKSQAIDFSKNTCGGIIGAAKNSKVTNCFSYADYPMIGTHEGMDAASGNNYRLSDKSVCNNPYVMGVNPLMVAAGYATYWLNNNSDENLKTQPWSQNVNQRDYLQVDPHPVLDMHETVTIEDITGFSYIGSAADLKEFAKRVNEGKDDAQYACAVVTCDINLNGEEWTPIGNNSHRFRGLFNGQGHTISGLNCTVESLVDGAGLFGVVDALAVIENVIIDDNSEVTNSTDYGAAGIVGLVSSDNKHWGYVNIRNCGNYASVSSPKHAGGILGRVMNNKDDSQVKVYVKNCFNMGTISATDSNSALLCGYMENHGVVRNCWSGGKLVGTWDGSLTPYDKINDGGGKAECLVGYTSGLDINNCYIVDPDKNVSMWFAELAPLQEGVTIVNAEDLQNGKLAYILNGNTNVTHKSNGWQQNLGANAHPIPGNKGIYHARNINKEYGTICLPYTLYSNDDIKYYAFSNVTTDEGETQLKFTYTDKVKPGTPTLFYAKAMGDHTFIDDFEKYDGVYDKYDFNLSIETGNGDWKMHSHPFEKVFEGEEAKTVYYVSGGEIRNAKKTTVAPYRAYFRGTNIDDLQSSSNAKVRIVFEDENGEVTSIKLVGDELVPSLFSNGKTYSIMGTEVGEGYRGIVIKNGKKMIQM